MTNDNQADAIEIRAVTAAEVDAIAALAREIWNRHYPGIISQAQIDYMLGQRYHRQRLLEELQTPGLWWDQAWLGGRRAGFASALLTGTAGEVKLDKIYVHPDLHRRGIGAALIGHVVRRARGQGCTTLVLAVNKGNAAAIAAYEKSGFSVRDAVRVEIGGGFVMDDYIMAKPL